MVEITAMEMDKEKSMKKNEDSGTTLNALMFAL